ncbi:MAG: GNAT family N-acetyltransferase [Oscillospiraceae bacterium]|nr:GNAT family N-acetyltransferase [Oscillospiraceae bacterium]
MITIRTFTREDAETVRQILYPDLSLTAVSELIDEWNSGLCRGRAFEIFAVLSDERLIGTVSLYEHSEHTASLGAELIPEERGKGAAAEALSHLMRYAAEKGYRILLDQVRRDNAASIRLHEKLGFETDGYGYRNQKGREVVLYLKPL